MNVHDDGIHWSSRFSIKDSRTVDLFNKVWSSRFSTSNKKTVEHLDPCLKEKSLEAGMGIIGVHRVGNS